jgi:dehydratase
VTGFKTAVFSAAGAMALLLAACTTPAVGGGGGTTTTAGPTTSTTSSTTSTTTSTTSTTVPPSGPVHTVVSLSCLSTASGQQQTTAVDQGITVDAPTTVAAGNNFDVTYDIDDLLVPASGGGYPVIRMGLWEAKVDVAANSSYDSASLSGGGGYTSTPTVELTGSTVHFKLLEWVTPGTTVDFPTITVTYQATGTAGAVIDQTVHGSSFADWGLAFANTVQIVIIFPINIDAFTQCFPITPVPILETTLIT